MNFLDCDDNGERGIFIMSLDKAIEVSRIVCTKKFKFLEFLKEREPL